MYGDYGLTEGTYTKTTDEEGKTLYKINITPESGLLIDAFKLNRVINRLQLTGHGDVDYSIDRGYDKVTTDAQNAHDRYIDTGSLTMYSSLLSEEEATEASKINTALYDYTNQEVPKLIKNGLDGWDAYVEKVEEYDVETVCGYYQPYIDQIRGK